MLTCDSWFRNLVMLIVVLQSNALSAVSSDDVDPFIGTGGWFQSTGNVFWAFLSRLDRSDWVRMQVWSLDRFWIGSLAM